MSKVDISSREVANAAKSSSSLASDDNYYELYKKYKQKYLNLKKEMEGKKTFDYLHKESSNPLEPREYQLELISKHLPDFPNSDALEIGVGNARRSMGLSKLFKSYTGIEPSDNLFKLSQKNCKDNNCTIKLINDDIISFTTNDTFDIIILINTFHFVPAEHSVKKFYKLLNKGGIVLVDEPKPIPKGWGSPKLNEDSGQFNPKVWKRKETSLNNAKNYLLEETEDLGFECEFYDEHPRRNVFVLIRK